MASTETQVDAVKSAVSSIATCTPATTVRLRYLLLPKDASQAERTATDGRAPKAARSGRSAAAGAAARAMPRGGDQSDAGELSARDKAALATHVINATLRALGEAARPAAALPPKRQQDDEDAGQTARKTLRRSSSAPTTPLQPRSVNRVSTSPALARAARAADPSPGTSVNCLSTVECARVAFSALRSLQSSGKLSFPDLQLDSGLSSLVGKLIGLGLHEQAVRDLRVLKARLDRNLSGDARKRQRAAGREGKAQAQGLADMLDFGGVKPSDPALPLVVATQINILKLLSAVGKPAHTEAALAYLRESHPSSPLNHLLSLAEASGADSGKAARQLEAASQLLLSLTPGVSSKDDGIAADARLSISPASALELQTLGLVCRLRWWDMSRRQGNVDRDILSPLSKCLLACSRRLRTGPSTYGLSLDCFSRVHERVRALDQAGTATTSKSPLAVIYQLLTTLAREAGELGDAVRWAAELRKLLAPESESAGKWCSVTAQLLALQLRHSPAAGLQSDELVLQVLAGIQGSLRGDTSELEELLANLGSLRRAAMAVLLSHAKAGGDGGFQLRRDTRRVLETLVLQCPRFCLRWLGKAPDPRSSTKDYLRYEQRRQLLSQSVHHTLDSAFLLAKTQLEEQRVGWDALECLLNDSLSLLACMGEKIQTPTADEAMTYYVKISHFYYMKYTILCRQSSDQKDAGPLRALRRSVECVKDRPRKEKDKAQLLMKLERLVEICRGQGRIDEALGALQSIRNSLVDDGVLERVAETLTTHPPHVAWSSGRDAEMLSRTLSAIAKTERVWINWAADLSEAEQAAVLEHRLWFVLLACGKAAQCPTLDDPAVDTLLRIYNPTRFPIRRLRTLLRLLCSAVGHADLIPVIRSVAADAGQLDAHHDLGEDVPLAKYLAHMKTLHSSVISLVDGLPDPSSYRGIVAAWRSLLEANGGTPGGLDGCIDNVSELIAHLQSVSDFLQMQGRDELLSVVLELAADIAKAADGPKAEDFLNSHAALALQCVAAGRAGQAERLLQAAGAYNARHEDIPGDAIAAFHLASTEYYLSVGDCARAIETLRLAREVLEARTVCQKAPGHCRRIVSAYASYLCSLISLERGDVHHALSYSKESLRVLFQEWGRHEAQLAGGAPPDKKAASADDSTAGMPARGRGDGAMAPAGLDSWKALRLLIQGICSLSAIYDHMGMFQETLYYAEQAEKLARRTGSERHLLQCVAWMASVLSKAGKHEKALEFANQAKSLVRPGARSCWLADLACQVGSVYRRLGEAQGEAEMIVRAESVVAALASYQGRTTAAENQTAESADLASQMASLDIEGEQASEEKPTRRRRAATTSTRRKAPVTAATTTRTKAKAKAASPSTAAPVASDVCVGRARASILVQKAAGLLTRNEWATAAAILREARELTRAPGDGTRAAGDGPVAQLTLAACLLGQSLEDMTRDPVFSVVHDSTLSFPTILGSGCDQAGSDRPSMNRHSPPAKTRSTTVAAGRKGGLRGASPQAYVEALREAQECLLEAHATATALGDSSLLHRISTMLQSVSLLVSTTSAGPKTMDHIVYATSSTELARVETWRREWKAVAQEKAMARTGGMQWPAVLPPPAETRRPSPGSPLDLGKFQRDYVDILPQTWSAVSISLGEDMHDLCITKLQAGHSPFVVRLPLGRAGSRDLDSEAFGFEQGRAELLDIIRLANETCHDARDMSAKGAKSAWWAEREALDRRLGDLLQLIESDWLGGFRGIFSHRRRRPDLLARFQKSFQNVLDRHLPSRQQRRGRRARAAAAPVARVTLDPRILELFVGLGDATREDRDLDDELTDLLYFVVDILQFNGERNACDEIDFDMMIVEILDALGAYQAAARADDAAEDGAHTILVLDKTLHAFPWESLPCMRGLAVSRVPSLACLRQMILEQRAPGALGGHHVSSSSGTYILNPSSDLKTTLGTFEQPLARQLPGPSWTRIVSRAPTEDEFERALRESDVVLYFGHGSGAQYIRGRTVRRLDRCRAAALLWGCSSASLADAGEYEAHGPVWNYLLAGCPAVVGTLWDVTDKDIDRLAGRALEEWGLLARGTGGNVMPSLVEAVARAREEACRFRYLTAAAVTVYGIPVYIEK